FQVSTEALERSDPQAAQCYRELAVFPPHAEVPEAAVLRFWCHQRMIKDYEARKLLATLERRALLTLAGQAPHRRVALHDLQYDYLNAVQVGELKALHERLLSAYAPQSGGWPAGPNDGYFFQRLDYHLLKADRKSELRSLLTDFDWLQNRLLATNVADLNDDFNIWADEPEMQLVQDTLSLSAHILAHDGNELAGQLLRRLLWCKEPAIQALLSRAGGTRAHAWLRPLTASLTPSGPLRRTLTGHSDDIAAVGLSADGRIAVTASLDKTLKVWNTQSGTEIRTLAGHTGPIRSLALTPDAKRAVSGSDDGTARVWDLETGQQLAVLAEPTVRVTITPDGRVAVTASQRTIKAWDVATAKQLQTFRGHSKSVTAVATAPSDDGQRLISCSEDNTVRIWDLESGRELRRVAEHSVWSDHVAITADGKNLIGPSRASEDPTEVPISLRDLESGRLLKTVKQRGSVDALAATADGHRAVSLDLGTLRVWDLQAEKEIRKPLPSDGIGGLAITPDGRWMVS